MVMDVFGSFHLFKPLLKEFDTLPMVQPVLKNKQEKTLMFVQYLLQRNLLFSLLNDMIHTTTYVNECYDPNSILGGATSQIDFLLLLHHAQSLFEFNFNFAPEIFSDGMLYLLHNILCRTQIDSTTQALCS